MDPRFALLLACFFLSGFTALLYQTAWTRELSFVFGTSELAVAAVLAAYMGGLALGAAAAARRAARVHRPVLTYGVLEMGVAVCALAVPWGIRGVDAVYVGLLGGGGALPDAPAPGAALFQLAGAFAVLLPPTAFMGATLPLLTRHAVRREEEIASRVGVLYAVNTAGAIAGTLCAAFWLMPELGLRHTVWSGAALNVAIFGLAAALARGAPRPPPPPAGVAHTPAGDGVHWILPAVAVSGAVSFAYEVLWTRLLGHLLGASLHAFATMLASFLLGIALGSAVAARLAATRRRGALGFALAQLGIAIASYAAFGMADRLPDLSARVGAGPAAPLASALVAGAVLLPITLCIGATFPFAVRALARRPDDAARATARVYAWNTVGAIAGALGAGFVLLPSLRFAGTLTVGVAANLALAGLAAFAARPRRLGLAGVAGVCAVAIALVPARTPWTLLTSTPMLKLPFRGKVLFYAVGRSSTVVLADQGETFRLASNGLPEAGIDRAGLLPMAPTSHWMGALPTLLRPGVRDLLLVGLGGGVALELVPSTVRSIDVIELEPEIVAANRRIEDLRARDPLKDPRVRVHLGDARGSMQLSDARYDAIVSQPSHPWTAGASHLYTREFFSLVRSHLEPGGVFVQWIGLRFVDEALLRSLLATLASVFPHVELYRPEAGGLLFAASTAPIDGLAGAARALKADPADLARLGLARLEDVASAWALDEEGVRDLAEGAPLNTDDHNRLASRASQLGDAALGAHGVAALLGPFDPLRRAEGLDRSALIRSLAERGFRERAADLARAGEEADEETGLGWLELTLGRSGRAGRHFARALSLSPGDTDAVRGLVGARKVALARGEDVAGISPADLDPRYTALIAGWRRARERDWDAVAALEPELARIAPGHALFEEAARLRIVRLLESDDPEASARAQALAETLLLRRWHPLDSLFHARAAIGAGRPLWAWGSLERIAARLSLDPRGRALAKRALEVAEGLPDDMGRELREKLARHAGLAR